MLGLLIAFMLRWIFNIAKTSHEDEWGKLGESPAASVVVRSDFFANCDMLEDISFFLSET